MRKATLFWLAMTVACGAVLFHTSQRVTDGRSALAQTERELLREEESLRVLHAEWSYLNQPERLEKLARQHLELVPLNGKQFASVADLNERLDEEALATAATTKAVDVTAPDTPVAAPHIEPAAGTPPAAKPAAPLRQFGDVLKNLGVN